MAHVNWVRLTPGVASPPTTRAGAGRPRSGARPAVAALMATLVGLGVGVGAWSLAGGSEAGAPPAEVAGAGVTPLASASLLQAASGVQIAPADWVGAVRALATSRAAVAGTMQIVVRAPDGTGDAGRIVGGQSITFGVTDTGQYAVSYPGSLAFSTPGGAEIQVQDSEKLLTVQAGAVPIVAGKAPWIASNGEPNLPNDAVSRVLYPDRWIETMQTGNDVTITSLGSDTVGGRNVTRYKVTFGKATTKYSEQGWDFVVDSATGVLVQYVIHYSAAAGGGSETVEVTGLGTQKFAAPDAAATLPSGYRVQAAVRGTAGMVAVSDQVLAGDTVTSLLSRLEAASAAAIVG